MGHPLPSQRDRRSQIEALVTGSNATLDELLQMRAALAEPKIVKASDSSRIQTGILSRNPEFYTTPRK